MKLPTFVFVCAMPTLAQTPPLPNGKTILERSVAASGGLDARNAIKTQKLVGKMALPVVGVSGMVVTYRSQKGEMYQIVELPGAGKIEVGNNGNVEWERTTLTGPKVRRVASTPGNLLEPDPTELGLADKYSKIETVGLGTVNGKPCFNVQLVPKNGGVPQTACYDRETFLPVQLEINIDKPIKVILGDYRSVGGVKMPFLIETEAMGQTIRLEMETITLNDPLPPEATDLPDEIEKLAFHTPIEVREAEDDKDRPTLRRRTKSQIKK